MAPLFGSGPVSPLSAAALRDRLERPRGPVSRVTLLDRVGSTNQYLLDQGEGAGDFALVAAEDQCAGRGRLGRDWLVPAGRALTWSIVVPRLAAGALPWLPFVAGAAIVRSIAPLGVSARLKWPNDVVVAVPGAESVGRWGTWRKLGGILIELPASRAGAAPGRPVVGVGLNVNQGRGELPVAWATSLRELTHRYLDRTEMLMTLVSELSVGYDGLANGDLSSIRRECTELLAGIGGSTRVVLPGGKECVGTIAGIDRSARLRVRDSRGMTVTIAAGDIAIKGS